VTEEHTSTRARRQAVVVCAMPKVMTGDQPRESLLAGERKRDRKPYPLWVIADEVTGTVVRLVIPKAGYRIRRRTGRVHA
jgi:hypothetical protein